MGLRARTDRPVSVAPALALRGISKQLGSTRALEDAHCTVRVGTVHALLGENGAGKTTLMRIAFGALEPDAGSVALHGATRRFHSSRDAIAAGIGMVHQHFMLVPAFTVTENVALGSRRRFNATQVAARIRALGVETGLAANPDARVRDLAVGAQQRVEVLKALANGAQVLILDEPTAVLSPAESEDLYRWIRRFVSDGGTVVLITHRLAEALAVADDVTVLRRGRTVLAQSRSSVDERTLVEALGGDAAPVALRPGVRPVDAEADIVFALEHVDVVDARGVARLRDASLTVRRGEVLGVIGVENSGQRELLRVLAGRLEPSAGRVTRPARVGFVPEDRLADALIPTMSLTENLVLADAGIQRGVIPWAERESEARAVISAHEVVATGPRSPVAILSGGNQQKFVVGRERAVSPAALVAENPTRGLDLRASARVLAAIAAAADEHRGAAVVFSSDLDEILGLTSRIVACHGGRVTEVPAPADRLDRAPYTRALLGLGA
ncbi:MAG: ATP-binding cassette domain-containing protein [Gemmatimonadaceae bacterium]